MNDFGMSKAPRDGLPELSRTALKLGLLTGISMAVGLATDPRWIYSLTGPAHPVYFMLATGAVTTGIFLWCAAATGRARDQADSPTNRAALENLTRAWYGLAVTMSLLPVVYLLIAPTREVLHWAWLMGLPYGPEQHEATRFGIDLVCAWSKMGAASSLGALGSAGAVRLCQRNQNKERD